MAPLPLTPGVALLDDEAVRAEPEKRGAGDGLDRPVARGDGTPPVNGRAIVLHERPGEAALRLGLVLDILGRLKHGTAV